MPESSCFPLIFLDMPVFVLDFLVLDACFYYLSFSFFCYSMREQRQSAW